ncbi:MAG: O-antigen ligase family protein [Bacteroidia bacterium]|nr:O-antigen ligase family protein [Bacteroidia bacterium]MDW8157309.1 O-antigen ligase family protein [Bacteroidia bacterium]
MPFIGFLLIAVGLTTSPALVSIGVGAIGLYIFFNPFSFTFRAFVNHKLALSLSTFFIVHLIAIAFTVYANFIWHELKNKFPFLIIPLAWGVTPTFSVQQKKWIYLSFITTIMLVSLATLINYTLHFEQINRGILQSKSIPIISLSKSISHIYFSFMSAFAIGLCWVKELAPIHYYYRVGISLFLILCLHLFATRTGLFSFYVGIIGVFFYLLLSRQLSRKFMLAIGGVVILAFLGIFTFSSVQNRIKNTIEDWQIWSSQKHFRYYSLGNRFFIWQVGVELVSKNLWLGVGPASIPYLLEKYHEQYSAGVPTEAHLKDFHNQWLEYCVGLGVPLALVLLVCFLLPLFYWRKLEQPLIYLYFLLIVFSASLVESILERQMGISFFICFQLLLSNSIVEKSAVIKNK